MILIIFNKSLIGFSIKNNGLSLNYKWHYIL